MAELAAEALQTLERRLERLERRRHLGGFALGLLAGLGLAALAAARPVREDALEAQAFRLYDGEGRLRGELGFREGGVGLYLLDEEQRERALLLHDGEQTGLFVRDAEQTIRVGVAQFAHGGGGVALHGPEAKGAAVLYLKGEGSLTFYDAEGGVAARVPAESK